MRVDAHTQRDHIWPWNVSDADRNPNAGTHLFTTEATYHYSRLPTRTAAGNDPRLMI